MTHDLLFNGVSLIISNYLYLHACVLVLVIPSHHFPSLLLLLAIFTHYSISPKNMSVYHDVCDNLFTTISLSYSELSIITS